MSLHTAIAAPIANGRWIDRVSRNIGGVETAKKIGESAGISALFVIGGWLNDHTFKDASPNTKRLVNAVFGAPLAMRTLPELKEHWHKEGIPDFLMTALTTTIGVLGGATNDREMMQAAAMLSTMFGIAGALEDGVTAGNEQGLVKLEESIPKKVTRSVKTSDGGYKHESVDLHDIKEGDYLVIKHGETVPVDGVVRDTKMNGKLGTGKIMLPTFETGEQAGQKIREMHPIPQGAISEGSEILMKATHTAKKSVVLDGVERLRDMKNEMPIRSVHGIKNMVNNIYIPIILAACGAQFAWTYYHEKKEAELKHQQRQPEAKPEKEDPNGRRAIKSLRKAVKRTTELAIKMAPCAITAAMLVLPFVKNRLRGEHGITIRHDQALERMKDITHVLTDIRGTLTHGTEFKGLHLWDEAKSALHMCEEAMEHHLLGIIGKAESRSVHSIAKSICNKAEELGHTLRLGTQEMVKLEEGGVTALLQEGKIAIGNAKLMAEQGHAVPDALIKAAQKGIKTQNSVTNDTAFWRFEEKGKTKWGVAAFEDTLRDDVVNAITELRRRGKKIVLVSGMPEAEATRIAASLDNGSFPHNRIEVRAGHLNVAKNGKPGKDDVVREFSGRGRVLAAIGDEGNDAHFMNLVRAQGGVAFAIDNGGIATPGMTATKDAASVVMEGIHQLPGLMDMSKSLSNALMLNVGAAVSWMSFLVGSHVFGVKMNTQQASILHETPTILLTLGSLLQNFRLVKNIPTSIVHTL